jgi:TonB C terminal
MQAIVLYVVNARGGNRVAAFRRGARRLARCGWALASGEDRGTRKFLVAAYAALLTAGIYTAEAEDRQVARAGELIAFDIPRQSLAGALQAYGQATGIQVLYESNSAVGRASAAVEGKFTADAALHLLLKETELKVRYIRPDAITLALPSAEGVNYALPATPLASSSLSLGTLRVRGTRDDTAGLQDFSQRLQMDIQNALRKNPRTRDGSYRAVLDLWIDPARMIERTELLRSTGDRDRDVAVAAALRGVTVSRPPANTPQPVRVVIVVKSLQ